MDNGNPTKTNGVYAAITDDEEKKNPTEEIIQEVTKRSHSTKWNNSFTALYYSWMPLFLVNSYVIFFRFQAALLDLLNRKLRYFFTIESEARTAGSLDGAALAAEALGLTTSLMVVILPTLAAMRIYRLKQLCSTKQLTNTLISELKKRKFSDPDIFKGIDADKEKLKELISIVDSDSSIESNELTEDQLKAILNKVKEIPLSRWEKFAEYMQWFTNELSPYVWAAVELSHIASFTKFYHELTPLAEKLNCSKWSLLTDSCPGSKQYDLMALTIYPWIIGSGTYFTVYALGVFARLALSPIPSIRNKIYNNSKELKKKLTQWIPEGYWIYRNSAKIIIVGIGLPIIVGLAFSRAVKFANGIAASYNCSSIGKIAGSFITGNRHYNDNCTTVQQLNIVTGFLGDAEICKDYSGYYLLDKLSLLAGLAVACSSYFRKNERREYAQKLNKECAKISYTSLMIALLGIVVAGIYASAFVSPGLIANILSEGITNTYYIPPNGTWPFPTNTTRPLPANPIIPSYSYNNATSMLTITTAKPCPGYSLLGLLGANFVHKAVDCDKDLLVRAYQAIAVPFWISVSFTGGSVFGVSLLLLAMVGAYKYCSRKPDTEYNIPNPVADGGINNSDVTSGNRWNFFKSWCCKKEEQLIPAPDNSRASFCC